MTFLIRLAKESDAGQILDIYGPIVRDSAISFETEVPTEQEMGQRIRRTLPKLPWLVCERQGELLGYAYASRHRTRAAYQWAVDVSAYVHESRRRRGIGRALYSPLFVLLRHLGYFNAFAGVALPNPASVSFHQSMGFETVGVYRQVGYKLGKWHDVCWLQRQLHSQAPDPPPPRPMSSLHNTATLQAALREARFLLGMK